MRSTIGLIFWCGLCLAVGFLGSLTTRPAIAEWYQYLRKPAWTPPSWLFVPVWTVLYLLMGISAWLIWKPNGFSQAKLPLTLFLIQLIFNAIWSWLFFGLRNPTAGLIDIVLLWIIITATLVSYLIYNPISAWLFVPYLLWVSYAAILNLEIARLN